MREGFKGTGPAGERQEDIFAEVARDPEEAKEPGP